MTTYRILLDAVGVSGTHDDKGKAIEAADAFARLYRNTRATVLAPDNLPVYQVGPLGTLADEGDAEVCVFDSATLAELATTATQEREGQRKSTQSLCDLLVALLDTQHTALYPDKDGDQVIMTVANAEALCGLVMASESLQRAGILDTVGAVAQVRRVLDLMASRQRGSAKYMLTHEEVQGALDGTETQCRGGAR